VNQSEVWDDVVGEAWVRNAPALNAHSGPFGDAAMDALEDLEGAQVLDIGCGTGETTMVLGARVGETGHVTGVDLSVRMIEKARAVTDDKAQISVVAGDVLGMDFDARFNALYSRFGVMFFDDPVAAFGRLRALTRTGGQLAFSAWRDPFSNPWMLTPVLASATVLGPPDLPPPGAPGPFSLGAAEDIESTLGGAGWHDVEVTALELEQVFVGDASAAATMVVETNPMIAGALRAVPDRRAEVVDIIAEALAPDERNGDVTLAGAAWIVRATA
jgi:SAM-dependent methyltransferase